MCYVYMYIYIYICIYVYGPVEGPVARAPAVEAQADVRDHLAAVDVPADKQT